jgi:hypothetical protein
MQFLVFGLKLFGFGLFNFKYTVAFVAAVIFERVGIVFRNLLAIVHLLHESMVYVCWRGALEFYCGKKMYDRVTSVIMQALESYLKKVKAHPQAVCYPVFSEGATECHLPPLSRKM